MSMFINVAFMLLDYVLNFTWQSQVEPESNQREQSLTERNKKSSLTNVFETQNQTFSYRNATANSQSGNEQPSGFQLETELTASKDLIQKPKSVKPKKSADSDSKIDFKFIYVNTIILFLGNYHLSHQYDIKVRTALTTGKKSQNSLTNQRHYRSALEVLQISRKAQLRL